LLGQVKIGSSLDFCEQCSKDYVLSQTKSICTFYGPTANPNPCEGDYNILVPWLGGSYKCLSCPVDFCMKCSSAEHCDQCAQGLMYSIPKRQCVTGCELIKEVSFLENGFPKCKMKCSQGCKLCISKEKNRCLWCKSNKMPNILLGCQKSTLQKIAVISANFEDKAKNQDIKVVLN